jgi:DNA-binding transcriptional ArsR family regulator
MVTTGSMAQVAALVGDPARASMLQALMDGRALTASELAGAAGVAPQTASGHLAQLAGAGLVTVARQGRHRYHRLATPLVARMLESVMLVAANTAAPLARTGPGDPRLRLARTCYDHIAGRLGVALADAMAAERWIEIEDDAGLITPEGLTRLAAVGIDVTSPSRRNRKAMPLCRPCLDWSERRPHLAGRLGAALCAHGLDRGWIRKRAGSRALDITPEGRRAYHEVFRVEALEAGP